MTPIHPILAVLLAVTVCMLTGCSKGVATRPPECRLPARTAEAVPRQVLSSKTHYWQRDPRWRAEPIGGSGKPLGNVGCTLCCVSMALSHYGIARTPAELNRELQQADGFTDKGWVRWAAVDTVTAGRVEVEWVVGATHRDIEEALAKGQPVIVKVAPGTMLQHWVILVGRDGREFLMRDPLDEKKEIKPLSSLGSDVLAVRVVKNGQRRY